MTTEWGTLAGVFPADEKTFHWFNQRSNEAQKTSNQSRLQRFSPERISKLKSSNLEADRGASYANILELDLSQVSPHVSGPNDVKTMSSVKDLEAKKVKIQKAYIVSCVNSRVDDLAQAAHVLKGKKIAEGVQLYLAAASSEVQQESERRGDWKVLLEAGAKTLPPGCGPCIGLGMGLLEKGEVGISATNRNFKGRMGHPDALTYLASPAVVAASAVKGYICTPDDFVASSSILKPQTTTQPSSNTSQTPPRVQLVEGFPQKVTGKLVFCPKDNLNTDGIYPGKYTYDESVTPEKQAQVVMENYDPNFSKTAKKGDILLGGFNFGTGSSREQAATALKYFGIPVLLAGSFSETFKRNALNNGYLCVEVPELVTELKTQYKGSKEPTIDTGVSVEIDFENSRIRLKDGKSYPIGPVGKAAQELILSEGLENWVLQNLRRIAKQ